MTIQSFASSFVSKFIYLKKSFGSNPFVLLDIGAGNHSASKTLNVFSQCQYYGIDIQKAYNNNEADFNAMHTFYEMDVTKLDFKSIPDNFFDGIWMVHILEHLYNGDKVVEGLLPKLKKGGYMYIEYPGQKSTTLPSMYGTLNFKDDITHVRVYSTQELTELFLKNNFTVLKKGTRRNIWFIAAMPFRIFVNLITGKKLQGNIFWDVLGFAEYVYVKK